MEMISEAVPASEAMPRFEDGTINLQELLRRMGEDIVNGVMSAEADQLCEATGKSRNGCRERWIVTYVGEITLRIPSPGPRASSPTTWTNNDAPALVLRRFEARMAMLSRSPASVRIGQCASVSGQCPLPERTSLCALCCSCWIFAGFTCACPSLIMSAGTRRGGTCTPSTREQEARPWTSAFFRRSRHRAGKRAE